MSNKKLFTIRIISLTLLVFSCAQAALGAGIADRFCIRSEAPSEASGTGVELVKELKAKANAAADQKDFFKNIYETIEVNPQFLNLSFEQKLNKIRNLPSLFELTEEDMIFLKTFMEHYGFEFHKHYTENMHNDFKETLLYIVEVDQNIEPLFSDKNRMVLVPMQMFADGTFIHFFSHAADVFEMMALKIRYEDIEELLSVEDRKVFDAFLTFADDFIDREKSFRMAMAYSNLERNIQIHAKLWRVGFNLLEEFFNQQSYVDDILARLDKYVDAGHMSEMRRRIAAYRIEAQIVKDGVKSLLEKQDETLLDVNDSIKKVVDLCTKFPFVTGDAGRIKFESVEDLPLIKGIPSQFACVWFNFIMNTGEAYLEAYRQTHKLDGEGLVIKTFSEIEPWTGRQLVKITFTDSGSGIEPDVISRIWEQGFTTKETGTGLGLAIVKKVIESHGGSITVESRYINEYPDSHGTTFTIRLPAVNIAAPAVGTLLFFHSEVSHPFSSRIVEQDL